MGQNFPDFAVHWQGSPRQLPHNMGNGNDNSHGKSSSSRTQKHSKYSAVEEKSPCYSFARPFTLRSCLLVLLLLLSPVTMLHGDDGALEKSSGTNKVRNVGAPASTILAVTLTKKASEDMRVRLREALGEAVSDQVGVLLCVYSKVFGCGFVLCVSLGSQARPWDRARRRSHSFSGALGCIADAVCHDTLSKRSIALRNISAPLSLLCG